MSEEEESANDQIIDNVENMLEALDAVPGQIEDDSNIEISTEERAKSTSDMAKIRLQELQVTIQLRKMWSIALLVLVISIITGIAVMLKRK